MSEFNPNSLDSKITLLLSRSEQDKLERTEFRSDIIQRLGAIETQCRATNGRVTKLEFERDANRTDVEELVGFKRFVSRYVFNRYALTVGGVFLIGLIRILGTEELRNFFLKVVGLE